jgi:dihydropteroate synthase
MLVLVSWWWSTTPTVSMNETGEVLACRGGEPRQPRAVFRGRSAKEVGIQLTEGEGQQPLSRLDHALYLGRELQKAEGCLVQGLLYVQD